MCDVRLRGAYVAYLKSKNFQSEGRLSSLSLSFSLFLYLSLSLTVIPAIAMSRGGKRKIAESRSVQNELRKERLNDVALSPFLAQKCITRVGLLGLVVQFN